MKKPLWTQQGWVYQIEYYLMKMPKAEILISELETNIK